jgi:hypothetical protein
MKAMNRPMPTAMAFFMEGLMAFMTASRTPSRLSSRKMRPAMKITPMRHRQGVGLPLRSRAMTTRRRAGR